MLYIFCNWIFLFERIFVTIKHRNNRDKGKRKETNARCPSKDEDGSR